MQKSVSDNEVVFPKKLVWMVRGVERRNGSLV